MPLGLLGETLIKLTVQLRFVILLNMFRCQQERTVYLTNFIAMLKTLTLAILMAVLV